jgi:hypothetical protein
VVAKVSDFLTMGLSPISAALAAIPLFPRPGSPKKSSGPFDLNGPLFVLRIHGTAGGLPVRAGCYFITASMDEAWIVSPSTVPFTRTCVPPGCFAAIS